MASYSLLSYPDARENCIAPLVVSFPKCVYRGNKIFNIHLRLIHGSNRLDYGISE